MTDTNDTPEVAQLKARIDALRTGLVQARDYFVSGWYMGEGGGGQPYIERKRQIARETLAADVPFEVFDITPEMSILLKRITRLRYALEQIGQHYPPTYGSDNANMWKDINYAIYLIVEDAFKADDAAAQS